VEELIGEFEAAGALEEAKARGLALIAEARDALANPAPGWSETAGSPSGDALEARRLLAGFTDLLR
jgi:hypothetical protein